MPIRPENRHFYQNAGFHALRNLLRTRAGDRCERCKVPNGQRVFFANPGACKLSADALWYSDSARWWYTASGEILTRELLSEANSLLQYGPNLSFGRWIDVVCGVSHLDHDPRHQDAERCAWLCARCHLAHDAADNQARKRRYAARAAGQAWLSDELRAGAGPEIAAAEPAYLVAMGANDGALEAELEKIERRPPGRAEEERP